MVIFAGETKNKAGGGCDSESNLRIKSGSLPPCRGNTYLLKAVEVSLLWKGNLGRM